MRPGVLLTLAVWRLPVSRFSTLDLPALERPANATSGRSPGGARAMSGALVRNVQSRRPGGCGAAFLGWSGTASPACIDGLTSI